jgi:hypothetical protein
VSTGRTLSAIRGSAIALVGQSTVSGGPATTLVSPALDLNTDLSYLILVVGGNATAGGFNLSMFYNADTTAANYERQSHTAIGASPAAARGNDAIIATPTASDNYNIWIRVTKDFAGLTRATAESNYDDVANISSRRIDHVWNSSANVTLITLSSSVSSTLPNGSYMRVWRLS